VTRSDKDIMEMSDKDIMEILEAYDLTRCAHSAAQLCGVDEKTVARHVAVRDAGGDPLARPRRVRSIDPFLPKVEEWSRRRRGASATSPYRLSRNRARGRCGHVGASCRRKTSLRLGAPEGSAFVARS
jgi:hypothetical protein